jgi:hypothetical protein
MPMSVIRLTSSSTDAAVRARARMVFDPDTDLERSLLPFCFLVCSFFFFARAQMEFDPDTDLERSLHGAPAMGQRAPFDARRALQACRTELMEQLGLTEEEFEARLSVPRHPCAPASAACSCPRPRLGTRDNVRPGVAVSQRRMGLQLLFCLAAPSGAGRTRFCYSVWVASWRVGVQARVRERARHNISPGRPGVSAGGGGGGGIGL